MRSCAVRVLPLVLLFAVVPRASAQETESADVYATFNVDQNNGHGPPLDHDLVVGDKFSAGVQIHNDGPSGAQVHVEVTWETIDPAEAGIFSGTAHRYGPLRLVGHAMPDFPKCHWEYEPQETLVCDLLLAQHNTYGEALYFEAMGPGELRLDAQVTSSVPDPNPANNTMSSDSWDINCSVMGTEGADDLVGTDEVDSICGYGGNDTFKALGKDDVIFGGAGDDVFKTSGKNPDFFAGGGTDTVDFSDATQAVEFTRPTGAVIHGSSTHMFDTEVVIGSRYDDIISGGPGEDLLVGARGSDRIEAHSGKDVLRGKKGRDLLLARDSQIDKVRGGRGSDRGRFDRKDKVNSVESLR